MHYPLQAASMGGILDGQKLPTREAFRVQMANLPPIDPSEVALAVSFADLVRDDYAEAAIEVIDATPAGHKSKLIRIGAGFAVGGVAGALLMYLARSKRK